VNDEERRRAVEVVWAFHRHSIAPTFEQQRLAYQRLSQAVNQLAEVTRTSVTAAEAALVGAPANPTGKEVD
jgi:hypothetical protein